MGDRRDALGRRHPVGVVGLGTASEAKDRGNYPRLARKGIIRSTACWTTTWANTKPPEDSEDSAFVRRAYMDVVGLLPSPEDLEKFSANKSANKKKELVDALLADDVAYADHWLTFWNDLLTTTRAPDSSPAGASRSRPGSMRPCGRTSPTTT